MSIPREIPRVVLSSTPHVDAAEFRSYVSRMAPLYAQLHRLKENEGEATPRVGDPITSPTPTSHNYYSKERGGNFDRKLRHEVPPLATVPDVYFDQNFQLENPRIFRVVSEHSEITSEWSRQGKTSGGSVLLPKKSIATNAILQEKLSWYMDIVEMHLANSISIASTTAFSVLGSLKELHTEAAQSAERIALLRNDLSSLQHDIRTKGLVLSQKLRVHRDIRHFHDAVLQLQCILDRVSSCKLLVDEGQVEKALDEFDAVESLMAGEYSQAAKNQVSSDIQLQDIRKAIPSQGVSNELAVLRSRVAKVFESRIHSTLIQDLQRHSQFGSKEQVLLAWDAKSRSAQGVYGQNPTALLVNTDRANDLRAALLPSLLGLHRSGSITTAFKAYRQLVLLEIRNALRIVLPNSTDNTSSDTSASINIRFSAWTTERPSVFAQNIQDLGPADAEELFSSLFTTVVEILRSLKRQSSILLDIACSTETSVSDDPATSLTNRTSIIYRSSAEIDSRVGIQEEIHIALDLPNLLIHGADIGHEMISMVLRVRSEQITTLPLDYFIRHYTLSLLFLNECESTSAQAGAPLRTLIDSQVRDFIQAHGARENQLLTQAMSSDTWRDADFTPESNEILQQVLDCSVSDPPSWTQMSRIWAPIPKEGVHLEDGTDESRAPGEIRGASIEAETFLLPLSATTCLEGVLNFLRLVSGIESKAPEVALCLISYLQLFDSSCRQLILGAGALTSAGLKNITATNLALAFQALSFISTLIPRISGFVSRHVPAGPANEAIESQFEKVHHAFEEHKDSIFRKLIGIMESRAISYSKRAREIAWEGETQQDVRKYMVDLVGDTSRLYKAIRTVFIEVVVEEVSGRKCMVKDIEYLDGKLGKIPGFGGLGRYLIDIVKSKGI
ncbi:GARP complex component [Fusarium subglutinans]|uniref:GARP complex component n=1 Tax=Gibberella subglutinans TaxID=42677 RepID=A0A8H5PIK3_GIBSU|nr:GARP complex component [Fusarium subglutinans]KAF5597477.1 GARP complex component [Fusarium subglutinans]